MKFTPESLIQIYLDGSFTEEAQSEFDALMRRDPLFAQQVTQAVAERVGPAPEKVVEEISSRLDSKMDGLWRSNRPSSYSRALARSLKTALVLAVGGGLALGLHHYWTQNQAPGVSAPAPVESKNLASKGPSNPSPASGKAVAATAGKGQPASNSTQAQATGKENRLPGSVNLNFTAAKGSVSTVNPAGSSGSEPGNPAGNTEGSGTALTQEGFPLRISVETLKSQNVLVTILDSNGLLVRHLYQGQWAEGNHLLDWDGKDEAGNDVPAGSYTVVVNAGGKAMSDVVTVRRAP